ncbi:MAG: MlaD family protein [Actinomycetota bacterium]|nr:MlaD family protein [Actinomycetota bacterium]
MRGSSATRSALGSPVLVGAVTILVTVVAVFLAYNANRGLPFVPTTQVKVITPNATKLVVGNEVREGGFRVGVIDRISPKQLPDGTAGAEVSLKIDQRAAPLPRDSTVALRPRSALGLRYVQLTRGTSGKALSDGGTLRINQDAIAPELEDFFNTFRPQTRTDIRANLTEFGGAFAGRGESLNRTFAAFPRFLANLEPVMELLADPETRLVRFFDELEDSARATAPVAEEFARGFAVGAQTFEAFSRDPRALRETISRSPETLEAGTRSLIAQRPLLRNLAAISPLLRTTARQVRGTLPTANRALVAGTRVLPRTPGLNEDLGRSLGDLRDFAGAPGTNAGLRGLTTTVGTLNPTIKYVGPFVTVCNYWNYWWTYLADHLSHEDETGTIERIEVKTAPDQRNDLGGFGASQFANGEGVNPLTSFEGDPVNLHGQAYGRAVNERGEADCENGQRGYPQRVAEGAPPNFNVALDPRTPGDQGPTFTGRPRVPEGQTFSAEPTTPIPGVNAP